MEELLILGANVSKDSKSEASILQEEQLLVVESIRFKEMANIRIIHKKTGAIIAEGPTGWGIFPFEGNYYISQKHLKTEGFKFTGIPGVCPYKFIYFWYHLALDDEHVERMIAWKYWVPNPLFPFIAWRIAVPKIIPRYGSRRCETDCNQKAIINCLNKKSPTPREEIGQTRHVSLNLFLKKCSR